ncbi:glycosyltransferase family 4 protein [Paenibacillus qinlingensis]|uniref:glycosyltransferase family 4 protein n=1 Tax=Paenibacillus qinlingensis TaxID=1837343 RepID=UPI001566301A|nr:glycosyltransferase family 4 protein [Paenibacillus qinlingensis]NQX64050.1 glycosyltransferase family 4 protein [Paenibacillus qinlingensis]
MKTKRKPKSNRLVIVTPGSFPIPSGSSSSVEQVVQKTAEQLVKSMPVVVLGRKASYQPWQEIRQGVTYHRVPYQTQATYVKQVSKQISALSPGIIQVDNRPRFLPFLRKRYPHSIASLVLHSTSFITRPYISNSSLTVCLRAADVIIVNSDFLKRFLQKKVPSAAHKIVTHYLGVDVAQFTSKWSDEGIKSRNEMRKDLDCEHRKIILFVGRLIPKKGVHYLLKAMKSVIKSEPSAKLVIVGSAFYGSKKETKYVRQLVKAARTMPKHVQFIPYVKHQEMPKWVRIADVFVVPSIGKEAFGLVNVEAMASGVPVVATRVGGIQEVVEDGKTGYLIEPGAIDDELPDRVLRLLKDETLQRKLGENGIKRVDNLFTWQRAAEVRSALYSQMLEETALV